MMGKKLENKWFWETTNNYIFRIAFWDLICQCYEHGDKVVGC